MKKTLSIVIVAILIMTMFTVTAFAAKFQGQIWTGQPNFLGMGYYCTAARNDSGSTSIDYAGAKCYNVSGACTSSGYSSNDERAVANNSKTKPDHGKGYYGQTGTSNYASATFKSTAWD